MDGSAGDVNSFIETNKHVLLLHNNLEQAKTVEFQFIRNGLERNENCIYATQEDPNLIKEKMEEYGIDVKTFLNKGLLHFFKPSNPFSHPEGVLAGVKSTLEYILKGLEPPYRMVAMLIPDTEVTEVIDVHIKIEKEFHANFENFNGSVMCTYDIKNLKQNNDLDRIRELTNSHHSVIYA